MPLILFTDLDGTLIDFETYSPELATPLARSLASLGAPLVFCSSKTRAEQSSLQAEMGLSGPCILENGSGISLPPGSPLFSDRGRVDPHDGSRVVPLGTSADHIRKVIRQCSREIGLAFGMYSDIGEEEVSRITGLGLKGARQAMCREFSETLTARHPRDVWTALNERLEPHGLQALCGGRFYTVSARTCDKGRALRTLVAEHQHVLGGDWTSAAIGDSFNDQAMLQAADLSYLVQRPDGSWSAMDLPNVEKVCGIGPRGWVKAVEDALRRSGAAEGTGIA